MIGYIYKTTNTVNGKIYIGQHRSNCFEPDKYMGSGQRFKKAVKKYGKEKFTCELLQECYSVEELNEVECYYISKYNSQDETVGYNILAGGETPWNSGNKMTEDYCLQDSIGQRNIAPNICMFDLTTGELVQVFNSCYDAAEYLNMSASNKVVGSRIHTVCRAKKGHAYGYIWRFERDYMNADRLSSEELGLEHTNPRAKIIKQCELTGELVNEYASAVEYARTITNDRKKQRNIAKTINETCRGNHKTYKGFVWKYKENE